MDDTRPSDAPMHFVTGREVNTSLPPTRGVRHDVHIYAESRAEERKL